MLSLQIIKMNTENSSIERLLDSFEGLVQDHQVFDGYKEICEAQTPDAPWRGIFYSHEFISKNLKLGLSSLMLMKNIMYDAFVLLKREAGRDTVSYHPRIFKRNMELHPDFIHAKDKNARIERLIDGYIYGA